MKNFLISTPKISNKKNEKKNLIRTIRFQIRLQKVFQSIFSDFNGLIDEINPSRNPFIRFARPASPRPNDHLSHIPRQHQNIPKPNRRKYLLIEQINREHTLDRVLVALIRVSHFADHKITQCYLFILIQKFI